MQPLAGISCLYRRFSATRLPRPSSCLQPTSTPHATRAMRFPLFSTFLSHVNRYEAFAFADPNAAVLYGLALLSLGFFSSTELAEGSPHMRLAAALQQQVIVSFPTHPGALHFLIHAVDQPSSNPAAALPAAHAYFQSNSGVRAARRATLRTIVFAYFNIYIYILIFIFTYQYLYQQARRTTLTPCLRSPTRCTWAATYTPTSACGCRYRFTLHNLAAQAFSLHSRYQCFFFNFEAHRAQNPKPLTKQNPKPLTKQNPKPLTKQNPKPLTKA
jgi:hypothetical protein